MSGGTPIAAEPHMSQPRAPYVALRAECPGRS
jgi:hypothetical protein